MRKSIVPVAACVLLVAVALSTGALDEQAARLHPALRALLSTSEAGVRAQSLATSLFSQSHRFQVSISLTGEIRIGVLVKLRDTASTTPLHGIPSLAEAGEIVALLVTLGELRDLSIDKAVVYVEPSWKTSTQLDRSVPAIGADLAHNRTPAAQGEGVIVGVVDTGIDYSHLDFRYDADDDGFEESSRIHSIWDQTWGLLGAEYERADIESDIALGLGPENGLVKASDWDGHGTHVASIAAGDGSSSGSGFVGVAPEATLIAVKTSFYTADILSGVRYVFDEADALGLPAVVNLSLGGQDGPHDGTSLFEEGLDQLAAGPGRAIVVSAGNEGDLPIHTSGVLFGGATSFDVVAEDWEIELSIWYPGDSEFTITVGRPDKPPISAPTGTDTGYVTTSFGTVYVDNASGGVNPNNGDHEAFIRLANLAVGDRWEIGIFDANGGGRFDAWVATPSGIIDGGDSSSTIDEPGNGNQVITVGSFNTKANWLSVSGSQDFSAQFPVGPLSSFSSHGPTRDGRRKPEICAPGAWICAARSGSAPLLDYLTHPDQVHVLEIGTSMAAPHVSGAVALLLERDPLLSAGEIRGILTSTAASDGYTGLLPNDLWGWGKLDTLAAVEAVGAAVPPEPPVDPEVPKITLARNPIREVSEFAYVIPAGASTATLRIFAVAGSLVFETSVRAASGTYRWNLETTTGQTLAGGLYLYVLVTDRGTSEVGKLVIER